ncbi:MAG: hypothetical protein M3461_01125, partial [Pseudomonadota bacterium]|nr:hypothetical protein [Pseudomonadota bacterium]
MDLREDERLCAIAFVKRMLPRLAEQNQSLIGWKVNTRSWPSTAYMAAVPWIKDAWEKDETQAKKLAELARAHSEEGAFGERDTRIACLQSVDKDFRSLDGNTLSGKGLARYLSHGSARFQPLPIRTAREVFPQAAHPASFIERV